MTDMKELRRRRRVIAEGMEKLARGRFDIAARAQFEALDAEQERLRTQIAALDPETVAPTRESRYRAFRNYLRFGLDFNPERSSPGISTEDRRHLMPLHETRALGEGMTGAGGGAAYPGATSGFYVPMQFSGAVDAALKLAGDMWASSTIFPTMTAGALAWPLVDDTSVTGELVYEGMPVSVADLSVISAAMFGACRFSSKLVKASQELAQDAFDGFENFLIEQFAVRIGRITNQKFTTGLGPTNTVNGVPAPEPVGIVTAAVDSGVTVIGDDNATGPDPRTQVGYTDLVNLESSVDVAYRRRGAWMLHDDTLASLKRLKDKEGRPLWKAGLTEDSLGTLLDHPIYLNQHMDSLGAGKKPVLFGDLKKYVIRTAGSPWVTRLTERFVDYGQIGFIYWARLDGRLLDAGTHPVKYLQQPN